MISVSNYILNTLVRHSISHVFSSCFDPDTPLRREALQHPGCRLMLSSSAQSAAFSADAYSRVAGQTGVVFAAGGADVASLVTGIAHSHADSVPLLCIVSSSHVPPLPFGQALKSITKYADRVCLPADVPVLLEYALAVARAGRPGAAVLEIPAAMHKELIEEGGPTPASPGSTRSEPTLPLEEVMSLLRLARRPVVLAGGGVRIAGAHELLEQFASTTGIPVALTLNGLDAYAPAVGFSGLYGNAPACLAVRYADVLLVLGARLGFHQVGKTKSGYTQAQIIHVDIDEAELGRSMPEVIGVHDDLAHFLECANDYLGREPLPSYGEWAASIREWEEKYAPVRVQPEFGISPFAVLSGIQDILGEDDVVIADVGQHQMFAAQGLQLKGHQRFLTSSGLGSMGYALPAAMGACCARPNATTVVICGDGGFQMSMRELEHIARHQFNVKVFVFNNQTLGMIKAVQKRHYQSQYIGTVAPDYVCGELDRFAGIFGVRYLRIDAAEGLDRAMVDVFGDCSPCVVEVVIDASYPQHTRYDLEPIFTTEAARYGQLRVT